MRPIRLELTAFGPFAGSETLEFAHLGDNPLFLINGPTGAGKTSILDAICYALYGETTGNEREAAQMRCHHAPPDTLTEVTFLFELAGMRYRIRRVPEQERPRKSGAGTTRQQTEAQLHRIAQDGSEELLVARKVSDATLRMIELTGLSAEQFRQVMVLPQGKFRELLLAPSDAREKIFQQLFQTQVYSRLETLLRERAATLEREVGRLRTLRDDRLRNSGVASSEALAGAIAEIARQLLDTEAARRVAEQEHSAAEKALADARQTEREFAECAAARAHLEALESGREAHTQDRRSAETARTARSIAPVYEAYEVRVREHAEAGEKLRLADEALKSACVEEAMASSAKSALDERKPQLDSDRERLIRLRGMVHAAAEMARADRDLAQKQVAHADALLEANAARDALERAGVERAALSTRIDTLRGDVEALANNSAELEQARRLFADRRKLDGLIGEIERECDMQRETNRALEVTERALDVAMRHARVIEDSRTQGQAALLAARLQPDAPCPVCGSREHPQPASGGGDVPDEAELEAAKAAELAARTEHERLRESLGALAATIAARQQQADALRAELGETAQSSLPELSERCAGLQRAATRRETLRAELAVKEAALAEHGKRIEKLQIDARSMAAAAEAAALAEAGAIATLTTRRELVPHELRVPGALDEAIAALAALVEQLAAEIVAGDTGLAHAREQRVSAERDRHARQTIFENATAQLVAAEAKWNLAMSGSRVANVEQFRTALLETEALDALEKQVRDYQDALLLAQQNHQRASAAIEGRVRADVALLEQIEQERRARRDHTIGELRALAERHATQIKVRQGIEELAREQAAGEAEYAVAGRLSQVAGGNNAWRVNLQRFVLGVLLDDVLTEAGHRLQLMSKGRYTLLRRTEAADKRRGSGLDLDVEDAYTGTQRAVATLSGGESFMAALSLALGLSDVVQAYSGGIRLDTLFIDEGFGSLDPESLDLAIRTLVDLQAAGRMVGIISHVPELKQQIAAQVVVEAGVGGSRLRVVGQ